MNSLITTASAEIVAAPISASLVLLVIVTCLALLIQKEIAGSLEDPRALRLSRALTVALIPLGVVFITVALLRLAEFSR